MTEEEEEEEDMVSETVCFYALHDDATCLVCLSVWDAG
jgi:hypothetical protein